MTSPTNQVGSVFAFDYLTTQLYLEVLLIQIYQISNTLQ